MRGTMERADAERFELFGRCAVGFHLEIFARELVVDDARRMAERAARDDRCTILGLAHELLVVRMRDALLAHDEAGAHLHRLRAERERRQTVLEAQAHQEAVVSRAEGDKRAKILAAEAERDAQIALAQGKAESIRLVYEAEAAGLQKLADTSINEKVLRLKGLDSLKEVANGRATKIFMPTDLSSIVSTLGIAGESMGIGDATPIDKEEKVSSGLDLSDPCLHEEGRSKATREAAFTSAEIEKKIKEMYNKETDDTTDD